MKAGVTDAGEDSGIELAWNQKKGMVPAAASTGNATAVAAVVLADEESEDIATAATRGSFIRLPRAAGVFSAPVSAENLTPAPLSTRADFCKPTALVLLNSSLVSVGYCKSAFRPILQGNFLRLCL